MADQFDLYRMADGRLVVVIQSDLLDALRTRVVVPLMPAETVSRVMPTLNPRVALGDQAFLFMPQLAATLTLAEMGECIGSLGMMRDSLVRAVDALLSGI